MRRPPGDLLSQRLFGEKESVKGRQLGLCSRAR